jgi:SAM-dependent methyltransferase
MTVDEKSYQVSAKYYDDAYAKKQDLTDLPFYVELAKTNGGPVFEIACGTGRILLPIARVGIEIHGLDYSAAMLRILKEHLQTEATKVQKRVSVFEGDMRSYRGDRKYSLVVIPFRPMQHMHTVQDQLDALKTAAFHLDENGMVAFDVFYPKFDLLFSGIGSEVLELEWRSKSNPDQMVRRYFRKDGIDKINQTFVATFIYRTYRQDVLINEETEPFKMSYYTYPHLKALFLMAGLEAIEEYGSFARTPLDNAAKEMIFLLKRRR